MGIKKIFNGLLLLLVVCCNSNKHFMQRGTKTSTQSIQILNIDEIKTNAENVLQKLDDEEKIGYSDAMKDVFKDDTLLIQGYIRKEYLLSLPECIECLILGFYFGILKNDEFLFYNQILADCEEYFPKSVSSIRVKEKETNHATDRNRLVNPNDLGKLDLLFVLTYRGNGYSTISLTNCLLLKNDLKGIVKLHKSGLLKINESIISDLNCYTSNYITRYLLENTENFDASAILLEYLGLCFNINVFKQGYFKKDMIDSMHKWPYVLALLITHSSLYYDEQKNFLAEAFKALESVDLNDSKLMRKECVKKIIQTLQKIYLGAPPKSDCNIL